ncbi:hypothetical protein HRI_000409400 [Hibiscus trionum]|uniref:DUF7745 domain-containing protein n=3 Tax=Hibiscus trionum TaxID=183268 RepID=A0A9W7LKH4_HIBTR|nr:hypothetical protein HRI_000409400 [Hibiscus trionum]
MENQFLDKVEGNLGVRKWSEEAQRQKGDSLLEGEKPEFGDSTNIRSTQNQLHELKEIWNQWDETNKQLFYNSYGDLPHLLDVNIDKALFRALAQFWNPAYSCFTLGDVDLVPTLEEYTTLIRCPKIQVNRAYFKSPNPPEFQKRLLKTTGMDEQWAKARIKIKGETRCIAWRFIQDLIQAETKREKQVKMFALAFYGLVIFPKSLGYIDDAVMELFDHLDKGITPVPAILAETFRSLSACKKSGEGRFTCCAQLLLVWFHSHFWKPEKVSYQACFENYSPLQDLASTPRPKNLSCDKWKSIFRNLQEKDVIWKARWFFPTNIVYKCGDYDWVPLLGIWGATGYAPLLVSRQYRSRQFIPATRGLATCEFPYEGRGYKKNVSKIAEAWKRIYKMESFDEKPRVTPEYRRWRSMRINDDIPLPDPENNVPVEEQLQVDPSEIEIAKHDFKKKYLTMENRLSGLENEKNQLKFGMQSQEREIERLRKGKCKAEEDLNNLRNDYKKLRAFAKYADLEKTSTEWKHEIQEEKERADRWEMRFNDIQGQQTTMEEELFRNRAENLSLRGRVGKLEGSLQRYRSRNHTAELKASRQENENMKRQVEDLEAALEICRGQINSFEEIQSWNNQQWQARLDQSQDRVRDRDSVMAEALVQVREVAEHLQTLAVQADVLSLQTESESDKGKKLAWLFRKIRILGVKAKQYM